MPLGRGSLLSRAGPVFCCDVFGQLTELVMDPAGRETGHKRAAASSTWQERGAGIETGLCLSHQGEMARASNSKSVACLVHFGTCCWRESHHASASVSLPSDGVPQVVEGPAASWGATQIAAYEHLAPWHQAHCLPPAGSNPSPSWEQTLLSHPS